MDLFQQNLQILLLFRIYLKTEQNLTVEIFRLQEVTLLVFAEYTQEETEVS